MGTITERSRKDGKSTFTAQIRLKRDGKVYHSEAQTFDRRPAAAAWLKKREAEIAVTGDPKASRGKGKTLGDAIDKYTEDSAKAIGRTKTQVLRSIKDYDLASQRCEDITSADLIDFARELSKDRQPQTVGNYLSHLGAIFAIAKPAWGYPLDQQAMKDAHAVARRLGLTGKGNKRDRRPTLDELDKLLTAFQRARAARPATNPMTHIVAFGIFSTRRQEEITRILWSDLDEKNSRILVRDMKNPGDKIGNHVWCDLPEPALNIIKAMPKTADEIFPYSTDAISAAFTRKCKDVGISDLHFHDLRHDGVSRLFEMGLNIPHVAAVSGHRSWGSLQRYTHVRQAGDKYADWPWLEIVTKAP